MKSTGIVRRIDELGRIVVPAEIRRTHNIDTKDAVEMFVQDDMIFLKKYDEICIFCSSSEGLKSFKDKNVCSECAKALKTQ